MPILDVKTQPRSSMQNKADLRNIKHAEQYILHALERAGASGNWLARATVKITWNNPHRRFQVRGINEDRKSMVVRVKPGDNGSAWEYDLCAPNSTDLVELRRLYYLMQYTKIEKELKEQPVAPPRVDQPLPPLAEHKTFIPVDDGSPTLRPCNKCGKMVDVGFKNRNFDYAEASRFCNCTMQPRPNQAPAIPVAIPIAQLPTKPISDEKTISLISRIATIAQRVQKRSDQKKHLLEQKADLEQQFEDLTSDMATVDAALKGIADEDAADEEAKAAMGILALMEGRV